MPDSFVKAISSPDARRRVLIVRRADGAYSYRLQWSAVTEGEAVWGPPGPYCGIYDSVEAAELEARARRTTWLDGSDAAIINDPDSPLP